MPARRLLPTLLAVLLAACGDPAKVSPPALALSSTSLAFAGSVAGAAPEAQLVTVTNGGGGTLGVPSAAISYASGSGWLSATVNGTAAPFTVTVQPSLAGLVAGTYRATVTVASVSAANSPLLLPVTFEVAPEVVVPALALSASAVEFRSATPGAAAPPQVVTATSSTSGALAPPTAAVTYAAGGPTGWLTVTVAGAAAPFALTFQADSTGLPLGLATATVEIASAGATGSPQAVAVTLWVGRVVEVRTLLSRWQEDGSVQEVEDPAVVEVALLQDDGAGGLLRVVAQPGLAPGRWLALAAPGAYWAELVQDGGLRQLAQADVELLDLGLDVGGRHPRVAATAETTVTLVLDGFIGWQPGDLLRLSSWGAQASAELAPDSDPVATPFAFDWATTMGTLLAPSDVLRIGHYTLALPEGGGSTGAFLYLEALATTQLSQVTLASGVAQELTPPAAADITPATVGVDWRMEAMEAAAAPFVPAAAGYAHRLGLYAVPAPLTLPAPLDGTPATVIESLQPAASPDLQEPAISIGRFLPAPTWREYQEVAFSVPVSLRAPGATTPLLGAANLVRAREAATATLLAQPLVGAPLAPTLDGADALQAGAVVPLTPTIAWSAPAGPAPTSYQVVLVELAAAGGATQGREVAALHLSRSSLKVPAGLLLPGRAYAAQLVAWTRPGDAGGATPFRAGLPEGRASIWTAVFTTAP